MVSQRPGHSGRVPGLELGSRKRTEHPTAVMALPGRGWTGWTGLREHGHVRRGTNSWGWVPHTP